MAVTASACVNASSPVSSKAPISKGCANARARANGNPNVSTPIVRLPEGGVNIEVRTVAGAAAVHLEDQVAPKRCGQLAGIRLIDAAENVRRLKCAIAARAPGGPLIIGRTDAMPASGPEEAIRRAHMYQDAGVDLVFVDGIKRIEEVDAKQGFDSIDKTDLRGRLRWRGEGSYTGDGPMIGGQRRTCSDASRTRLPQHKPRASSTTSPGCSVASTTPAVRASSIDPSMPP